MSVPSTEKCSSDKSRSLLASSSTRAKKASAMSPRSNRSRFFVNTVTSHTGSSMLNPTNHRKRRLYCSCSMSSRSLRTE
jgi:hypothetical protein